MVTAYAGRRVALLDRDQAPAVPAPAAPGRVAIDFGDDTMERVLGALEPVDHTTSFEHEPTERISLVELRADDAEGEHLTLVEPAPAPRTVTAGKRRASRPATRRPPILRSLPSIPAMLGIAVLAVSVGGTLVVHDPSSSAADVPASFTPASALTGTSSVGHVGSRASQVSRSSTRRAQDSPRSQVAAANGLTAQRTAALDEMDKKGAAWNRVLESNQWITPVTSGVYHLTARFGQYGLWASFHTGLDFAAPTGTPIHAIASGTVISASYDGAYGNKTVVRLADGTELWYCHQNEFAVSAGDSITQDEVIGYVGSTGHVTGPHVHIEVHPGGGDAVDPFPAFVEHGVTP